MTWKLDCKREQPRNPATRRAALAALYVGAALTACASENVPHRPFAQWADVPDPGQFVAGLVYEESEAYHIWANRTMYNVTVHSGGESYGNDINQGYLAFQYGIAPKWAADFNIGATTAAWRKFDPNSPPIPESTTGLMDWSFGVRYQFFNETNTDSAWLPTLTFRAGAVLPGTYDQRFVFAPGVRSAAIEPNLLVRKHIGWPGLGVFGDALYRWNRTTGNDQYITAVGLFQQIKGWEVDVGYRHLQTISGGNISYDPAAPYEIVYPRDVREIADSIDAGFTYTTSKHHIRYGFTSRTVFDGTNTDRKFWVGGSIDVPFDLFGHHEL